MKVAATIGQSSCSSRLQLPHHSPMNPAPSVPLPGRYLSAIVRLLCGAGGVGLSQCFDVIVNHGVYRVVALKRDARRQVKLGLVRRIACDEVQPATTQVAITRAVSAI